MAVNFFEQNIDGEIYFFIFSFFFLKKNEDKRDNFKFVENELTALYR